MTEFLPDIILLGTRRRSHTFRCVLIELNDLNDSLRVSCLFLLRHARIL